MYKVYLVTVEAICICEHETSIIPEDCPVPESIRSGADICPETLGGTIALNVPGECNTGGKGDRCRDEL
jgi:hypothetical protein